MFDSAFWTVTVKIVFAIVGAVLTGGIGYGIYYLRKYHPKSFADLKVVANTVVQMVVTYFKANPDVQAEAQVIYNLFIKYFTSIIPYATDAEIQGLFISVIDVIASALGVPVTSFKSVRVKISEDTYEFLLQK